MKENQVIGKILWWSERDGNGVICDPHGNEFYFDKSVTFIKRGQKLNNGSLVLFIASRCNDILTAKEVSIPVLKVRNKFEKRYQMEKNQLSFLVSF